MARPIDGPDDAAGSFIIPSTWGRVIGDFCLLVSCQPSKVKRSHTGAHVVPEVFNSFPPLFLKSISISTFWLVLKVRDTLPELRTRVRFSSPAPH
jgi:hypothetical protein